MTNNPFGPRKSAFVAVLFAIPCAPLHADALLDSYECNVHPTAASFIEADPCVGPCSESLGGGRFLFTWDTSSEQVQYTNILNGPKGEQLPSLWVEWRYRSNNLYPSNVFSCDARAIAVFRGYAEDFALWGDSAATTDGDNLITGLEPADFHTVRVELRPDEQAGSIEREYSIDGQLFPTKTRPIQFTATAVTFLGDGGCLGRPPTLINEWDFVRWGTLTKGETLVAVSPRGGLLPQSDRFSVTFDQPHYAFVDEIAVGSTEPVPPVVTRTWRIDGQDSNSFEIGLDRAIEVGETITVTIGDPADGNVVVLTGAEAGVPTASTWGLAALSLALCAAATILMRTRENGSQGSAGKHC